VIAEYEEKKKAREKRKEERKKAKEKEKAKGKDKSDKDEKKDEKKDEEEDKKDDEDKEKKIKQLEEKTETVIDELPRIYSLQKFVLQHLTYWQLNTDASTQGFLQSKGKQDTKYRNGEENQGDDQESQFVSISSNRRPI
jgi:hypothetical protein